MVIFILQYKLFKMSFDINIFPPFRKQHRCNFTADIVRCKVFHQAIIRVHRTHKLLNIRFCKSIFSYSIKFPDSVICVTNHPVRYINSTRHNAEDTVCVDATVKGVVLSGNHQEDGLWTIFLPVISLRYKSHQQSVHNI